MTIKVFHSKDCPYCKLALEKLKASCCDYELIDVDKHPEIADKYKIWSVPTTLMEDGTKVHTLRGIEGCQCSLKQKK